MTGDCICVVECYDVTGFDVKLSCGVFEKCRPVGDENVRSVVVDEMDECRVVFVFSALDEMSRPDDELLAVDYAEFVIILEADELVAGDWLEWVFAKAVIDMVAGDVFTNDDLIIVGNEFVRRGHATRGVG